MFIGRPVLWGLAHGGEEGVYNVVNLLKEEFNLAMALAGCVKIEVSERERHVGAKSTAF